MTSASAHALARLPDNAVDFMNSPTPILEAPPGLAPADEPSTDVAATSSLIAAAGGNEIALPAASRLGGQQVAPFLARHIPRQYKPLGNAPPTPVIGKTTKYCYRHRPDLKCRRQANEPSMEQLQNVCTILPPLSSPALVLYAISSGLFV